MSDHVQWIVKETEAEVREVVAGLQKSGWDIYYETVPLSGQEGFYCVKTKFDDQGDPVQTIKNVVWNLYDQELIPIVVDAKSDADILSFMWTHGQHEGFGYFEWSSSSAVGFVCHCGHELGRSHALRISEEVQETLSEASWDLLMMYHEEVDNGRD